MTHKPFVWAQGEKANVKEPVEILKEQGWRYGDVPAASNFNWLFKTLTEEITVLNKEVSTLKETMSAQLGQLKDKSDRIDQKTKVLAHYVNISLRGCRFSVGITRQICDGIRVLEDQLRIIHPSLNSFPWPLNEDRATLELANLEEALNTSSDEELLDNP